MNSLDYFRSMPTKHQDALGWRIARGNMLPASFWPGGQLMRKPDQDGGVTYFKTNTPGTLRGESRR